MKRVILIILYACTILLSVGAQQAKYIFYFIGDGMGCNQVNTTEMYMAELEGRIGRKQLLMTQLPFSGLAATFSKSNSITCSSAAGTALASGEKTNNGTLGLDDNGKRTHSIAEKLHEQGWGVGIMTSVSIDHATPGAFYAHVQKRNDYYTIGTQLAASGFDFFGGGTFYYPYPKKNYDYNNKSLYQQCREQGYTFARGYDDYLAKKDSAKKMILIQEHEGLTDDYKGQGMIPYRIDRKEGDMSLVEITKAAIDFLSSRHDRFFMMVEGGAIDWACHSNDAAAAINDVIEFDEALRVAYDFYLHHKDETLIVVTADHETGGLALGNSDYTLNLQVLQNQKVSLSVLSDELQTMRKQYGKRLKWQQVKQLFVDRLGLYEAVQLDADEDAVLQKQFKQMQKGKSGDVKTMYKQVASLARAAVALLDTKAHLGWTTGGHSASAVPVFAIGVGAEQFTGWQDNTELAPKILNVVK